MTDICIISHSRDHNYIKQLSVQIAAAYVGGAKPDVYSEAPPGSVWRQANLAALEAAPVILVMLSADLLADDYNWERLQYLQQIAGTKTAVFVICVRPCPDSGIPLIDEAYMGNPLSSMGQTEFTKTLSNLAQTIKAALPSSSVKGKPKAEPFRVRTEAEAVQTRVVDNASSNTTSVVTPEVTVKDSVTIYILHHENDAELVDDLRMHLTPLRRSINAKEGKTLTINCGTDLEALKHADLIILALSRAFLDDDAIFDEVQAVWTSGEKRITYVALKKVDIPEQYARYESLPKKGRSPQVIAFNGDDGVGLKIAQDLKIDVESMMFPPEPRKTSYQSSGNQPSAYDYYNK